MPIHCPIITNRISQEQFKLLSSEVMDHVFAIHNDFGRFFDEIVYKKELADRMSGVLLELEIIVTHGTFSKTYYVDGACPKVCVSGIWLCFGLGLFF